MSYFYIKIKEPKEIELLKDTVELIKENCIKTANKYAIIVNKNNHSNCILDNPKDNINLYENKNNFNTLKEKYKSKYFLSDDDVEIILKQYNTIDIESVEECKIQIKINYYNFIASISFIIDLLGTGKPLNKILNTKFNSIFTQVITSNDEHESAIIENNFVYYSLFDNGSYFKKEKHEINNELLTKYLLYKSFEDKYSSKEKDKPIKI